MDPPPFKLLAVALRCGSQPGDGDCLEGSCESARHLFRSPCRPRLLMLHLVLRAARRACAHGSVRVNEEGVLDHGKCPGFIVAVREGMGQHEQGWSRPDGNLGARLRVRGRGCQDLG